MDRLWYSKRSITSGPLEVFLFRIAAIVPAAAKWSSPNTEPVLSAEIAIAARLLRLVAQEEA